MYLIKYQFSTLYVPGSLVGMEFKKRCILCLVICVRTANLAGMDR
jgi:hypothetical protein